MEVEHAQVDELGAPAVGRVRHRARQRLLARLVIERDDLGRLHVRTEADDQLGQRIDQVPVPRAHPRSGGISTPGLRIPAGSS